MLRFALSLKAWLSVQIPLLLLLSTTLVLLSAKSPSAHRGHLLLKEQWFFSFCRTQCDLLLEVSFIFLTLFMGFLVCSLSKDFYVLFFILRSSSLTVCNTYKLETFKTVFWYSYQFSLPGWRYKHLVLHKNRAFPKHHFKCVGSGLQICVGVAHLCSSRSIHTVPKLVWRRN